MTSAPTQLGSNPIPKDFDPLMPETLAAAPDDSIVTSAMSLLNSYSHIFLVAFLVALLATPLIRRIAVAADVVDHPDSKRKIHSYPVAYLGGIAVFLGLVAAIGVSFFISDELTAEYSQVPLAIIIGMVAITFTGLADDVWGWDPRLKIAGQLVAAAALAVEEVGVKVAGGILSPVSQWLDPILGCQNLVFEISTPIGFVTFDTIYWVGTAIIAIFVLGGCNATNLIDGLDGLLSGIVAIVATSLLIICVLMALRTGRADLAVASDDLMGARIVLCVALLGAVLGFLPYNFNPATIFLGDCGSHLLGYMCVVIILMLGDRGETHLVFAGLIIFSVPIMDTTLAIIRRRLAGIPMSKADNQHIHHQLSRVLGVRKAVFALYGIGILFAGVGVTLAALVMRTELRVRVLYTIAIVLFSFIGVIAVKTARHQQRSAVASGKKMRAGPSTSIAGTKTAARKTTPKSDSS